MSNQPEESLDTQRLKGSFLEASPEMQKKGEAYNMGLMNLVYSKGTKDAVYQILQSGEPSKTIPEAATLINSRMKEAVQQKGKDVDLATRVQGVVFTTMELANLGTAAGFFKLTEDDMPQIVQESLKKYIHMGLKDGSIDPIEAQQAAESLMTEEEKAKGRQIAAQQGYPTEPGVSAAMEKYAGQRVNKERQKYMNRMQQMNKRFQDSQTQAEPQGALQQMQGGTV